MNDQSVSIHPYFLINPGCGNAFRTVCDKMIAKTLEEKGCLNYGFSFSGDRAFCRESYRDAESALHHLNNVGDELKEALEYAKLEQLEIHGSQQQLAAMQEQVAPLSPVLFTVEKGFRH